ncbi:MAG: mechanosensitive ion channel family protein [Polyangiales bacterium]|nr:mechanosensitive ion channel family protein [Myxococcales bacterium]
MGPRVRTFVRVTVAVLALVVASAARAQAPAQETTAGELAPSRTGAPVHFRGDVLFRLRASLGTLSPQERAKAIEARLETVASGPSQVLNDIHADSHGNVTELYAGETLILSIQDADAAPLGRTREQVAADYARTLRSTLRTEFSGRSLRGVLIGSALTLLVTFLAWLLITGTRRLVPWLRARAKQWSTSREHGLAFHGVELLSAARVGAWIHDGLSLLGTTLYVLIAAVYVEAVLSFFPWTRGLATVISSYVAEVFGRVFGAIFGYLPNLLYIAIAVIIARAVIRGAHSIFDGFARGVFVLEGFHPDWAEPTFKIVRVLIFAFAAVVIFPYLPGAGSDAFQSVSIFLGVLFSLGSSSAVANAVSGTVLTYMRPFSVGDRVQVADSVGDVIEKNLLVVRVRTIKNVDITIPNAMVLGSHIINYSACARDAGLILHTEVTLGYDVPWQKAHELLIAAAQRTERIVDKPAPFVLQRALNDFNVTYEINAYTHEPNVMAATLSALCSNVQDAFAEAGIEIMSPHYVAARDGNTVAIPEAKRPPGYEPPAFLARLLGPPPKAGK